MAGSLELTGVRVGRVRIRIFAVVGVVTPVVIARPLGVDRTATPRQRTHRSHLLSEVYTSANKIS
ncbi:MAG: hypothetical protein UW97_C0010G0011 [Parcubacteria group bacterium GW2011_GWA2_45_15]|nr:MAG: hypothetical protein UW97_C0010G0011 [Parcubacteria group bacterium GW2011_GWA2_45_15]